MNRFLLSKINLITDLSAEAQNLIEFYKDKRSSNFVWYKELGKDLINYIERPDFVYEVIKQLSGNISYRLIAIVELVEAISLHQIQNLLQDKQGYVLLGDLQGWLGSLNNSKYVSIDINRLSRLYLKIESIRFPIIINDSRPYMGEMVDENQDLGIDPSVAPGRAAYSFRFGGGHDGEHWLTKNIGAQVRATARIKGTILTYYNISDVAGKTLFAVMILMENTQTVLLLKDLVTVSQKIKTAPLTTKQTVNASKFTDRNGKPISKITLNPGDIIGTTLSWKLNPMTTFYSKYAGMDLGTFHFAFLKYEFAQLYRSTATGVGVATDDLRNEMVKNNEKILPAALSWFIPACSPESPVKCFK